MFDIFFYCQCCLCWPPSSLLWRKYSWSCWAEGDQCLMVSIWWSELSWDLCWHAPADSSPADTRITCLTPITRGGFQTPENKHSWGMIIWRLSRRGYSVETLQKILLINLKNIISNYWKFIIKSHIIFNIELTYLSCVWCREEHLYYVSIMQKGNEIWSVVMYVWSGVLCLLGELQWIASRLDTVRAAWTRAWDGEWSTTLSALLSPGQVKM